MATRLLKSLLADRAGGTAVEYGLLLSLISIALAAGLTAFSDSLGNVFTTINDNLKSP